MEACVSITEELTLAAKFLKIDFYALKINGYPLALNRTTRKLTVYLPDREHSVTLNPTELSQLTHLGYTREKP